MPLPVGLIMTVGVIGIGVLVFSLLVAFNHHRPIPNEPYRPQERNTRKEEKSNDNVRRRSKVCSICLEVLLFGQEEVVLPCKHRFHLRCITEWLKTSKTCPNCREAVSM